ncbi:hypothetical protein F4781DRAFT_382629 [Annulohypoxylon bovei var. microspora]|nr:hypothetical protein F4781DRAFT_382629 [Annulohypoxylon bovei var. microspora]
MSGTMETELPEAPPDYKFVERGFTKPWELTKQWDVYEAHEMTVMPQDVDGTLRGAFVEKFCFDSVSATRRLGNKNMPAPLMYKQWMLDAGFEDVVEDPENVGAGA